jgi:hypothetical protein
VFGLLGSVPSHDPAVEPPVSGLSASGDVTEQLVNTIGSARCDDPKLGKMGTDRIDHRGLLADGQMAGAMEPAHGGAEPGD